jgi:isocitrate dehydrogenase
MDPRHAFAGKAPGAAGRGVQRVAKGMEGAVTAGAVAYDLERQLEGAKLPKALEFAEAIIRHTGI